MLMFNVVGVVIVIKIIYFFVGIGRIGIFFTTGYKWIYSTICLTRNELNGKIFGGWWTFWIRNDVEKDGKLIELEEKE